MSQISLGCLGLVLGLWNGDAIYYFMDIYIGALVWQVLMPKVGTKLW